MNWNTLHCHPNCDGPYPCLVAPTYCELYATPEQCCEDNNQDADCAKVLSPPLPVEDCPVEGQCCDPDGECKTQVTCIADPCGEQTECSPHQIAQQTIVDGAIMFAATLLNLLQIYIEMTDVN